MPFSTEYEKEKALSKHLCMYSLFCSSGGRERRDVARSPPLILGYSRWVSDTIYLSNIIYLVYRHIFMTVCVVYFI